MFQTVVLTDSPNSSLGTACVDGRGLRGLDQYAALLTQTAVSQRLASDVDFMSAADPTWSSHPESDSLVYPVHLCQRIEIQATGVRLKDIHTLEVFIQRPNNSVQKIEVPYPSESADRLFTDERMSSAFREPTTIATIHAFVPVLVTDVKLVTHPADRVLGASVIDPSIGELVSYDFKVHANTKAYCTHLPFHRNGGLDEVFAKHKIYIYFFCPPKRSLIRKDVVWKSSAPPNTTDQLQNAFQQALSFFDLLVWPAVIRGERLVPKYSAKITRLFRRAHMVHHIDLAKYEDIAARLRAYAIE